MNRLQRLNATLVKKTVPVFEIGDTVRVHVRVAEGEKERVQVFEGVVISRKGGQNAETSTVRKLSYGVGVERIFPLHSPVVERIDLVRRGRAGFGVSPGSMRQDAAPWPVRSSRGRSSCPADTGWPACGIRSS